MGLLTLLRKIKMKEKELRILILGLDNAGKTTVVKKFNGEPTDKISPTLGFNIFTLGRAPTGGGWAGDGMMRKKGTPRRERRGDFPPRRSPP